MMMDFSLISSDIRNKIYMHICKVNILCLIDGKTCFPILGDLPPMQEKQHQEGFQIEHYPLQ